MKNKTNRNSFETIELDEGSIGIPREYVEAPCVGLTKVPVAIVVRVAAVPPPKESSPVAAPVFKEVDPPIHSAPE